MKTISLEKLEKRHLRRAAIRKLAVVSCVAAFLTFTSGAWIAPWIGNIPAWLVHQIPWWHQTGAFPDLFFFVAHPNMQLGMIWLGYYLATFLWATMTRSPRQKQALRAQLNREYREKYGDQGLSYYAYTQYYNQQPELQPQDIPLSQAWPGELKHQLVEHCYAEYRKALQRFDPPPLDLKTPTTFSYRKGGRLEWERGILVLPEERLTPARIHEILPFLAVALADYNAEQMTEEETYGFPDHVPLAPLLFFTGNFLWLLVAYKHATEGQVAIDGAARKKQQILERDEFAVLLGQGPALEHQLRRMEEELKRRMEIDTSIPTLVERIGRLSVLNEQERKEMRALGLTPKEPPLVIDSPFRQIGKGKKKKEQA